MTTTSDRFSLRRVNVLSSALCGLTRVTGTVIAPGNYGVFNLRDQIQIPNSNVGTSLNFPSLIRDYLYIDVEIFGGVCGLAATGPNTMYNAVGGVIGVEANSYVIRIPYCGPVDTIKFYLSDYVVRNVVVVFPSIYLADEVVNTLLLYMQDGGAITSTFQKIVAPGASAMIKFDGAGLFNPAIGINLGSTGYFGKIAVKTIAASGLPATGTGFTYFDGENSYSGFISNRLAIYLVDDGVTSSLGYIAFTNLSAEDITLDFVLTVQNIRALSTTYGDAT